MHIVYNSDQFEVLAYPAEHGLELVDKAGQRSLFIQGEIADRFHQSMREVVGEGVDSETVDDFLDEYCSGSAQPIIFH